MRQIIAEMKRSAAAGELASNLAGEARALREWADENVPKTDQLRTAAQ